MAERRGGCWMETETREMLIVSEEDEQVRAGLLPCARFSLSHSCVCCSLERRDTGHRRCANPPPLLLLLIPPALLSLLPLPFPTCQQQRGKQNQLTTTTTTTATTGCMRQQQVSALRSAPLTTTHHEDELKMKYNYRFTKSNLRYKIIP